LRRARLPEISGESLETFPRRVLARLDGEVAPRRAAVNLFPRLAWAVGLAACLLAALAVGRWHGRRQTQTVPSGDILASAKLTHEMLAMFPNRLRAIVHDARGLHLILSEGENVPPSTPIYARICDGKNCSSFVTFSGQEIPVAGQKVTALSDARGGIILTGSQFVWSSTDGIDAGQLKIEARNLAPAAM
jgi:hypothetical protein